jgi:hypothetical protein
MNDAIEETKKIPLFEMAKASHAFVYHHWDALRHLSALPMALYYLAIFVAYLALGTDLWLTNWQFAPLILLTVISIPFVVSWYRLALLGPEAIAGQKGLRFGEYEKAFFSALLFITIFSVFLGGMGGTLFGMILTFSGNIVMGFTGYQPVWGYPNAVGPVVMLVGTFFGLLLFLRMALLLPATAKNGKTAPSDIWSVAKGNVFRLGGLLFLVNLPVSIVFSAVYLLVVVISRSFLDQQAALETSIVVNSAIYMVQAFVTLALGATALSMSYQLLGSDEADTKPAA